MIGGMLDKVRDCILANNKYFCEGYSNVWRDEQTNQILTMKADQYKVVFPNDTLGDYFYLRNDGNIVFNPSAENLISDCIDSAYDTNITVNLVAIMDNADPEELLSNLLTTIQYCEGFRTNLVSASTNPSTIITNELLNLADADIQAALQRNKRTIVSLTFNMIDAIVIKDPSCIENPCKLC